MSQQGGGNPSSAFCNRGQHKPGRHNREQCSSGGVWRRQQPRRLMWHVWHQYTLQEYRIAALWWNLAILLCLLTKTVLKQVTELEKLGARLDMEVEKRNRRQR